MLIYSQHINAFIKKYEARIKHILVQEVGLEFRRRRFLFNGYWVPYYLVVFESSHILGFFNQHSYRIGLNRNLMLFARPEVIDNVLRHEIAHMLAFTQTRDPFLGHGQAYRDLCRNFGWGPEVYLAKQNLELANAEQAPHAEWERVLTRIKKLLSLATSQNPHEAQAATAKANAYLAKYHLQNWIAQEDVDFVYVKNILDFKRITGKTDCILEILKSFFVNAIYSSGQGKSWIEISGKRTNIEVASYVAKFLDSELDRLWQKAKQESSRARGIRYKNSFMRGIAQGYKQKLNASQEQLSPSESKALITMNQQLEKERKLVYGTRLGRFSSSSEADLKALSHGKIQGRQLIIRSGVGSPTQPKTLTWRSAHANH